MAGKQYHGPIKQARISVFDAKAQIRYAERSANGDEWASLEQAYDHLMSADRILAKLDAAWRTAWELARDANG